MEHCDSAQKWNERYSKEQWWGLGGACVFGVFFGLFDFLTNIWCFRKKKGGKRFKNSRILEKKRWLLEHFVLQDFLSDPGENSWPSLLCSSKLLNLAGWRYNSVEYYSKCLWGFSNKKSMHLINSTNLSNGPLKFPKHGKKQKCWFTALRNTKLYLWHKQGRIRTQIIFLLQFWVNTCVHSVTTGKGNKCVL